MAKLIRLFTKEQYNHISLGLDSELSRLYSFGRRTPRNPLYAGFVSEDIDQGFYHYFDDTLCVVYELTVTQEQYHKLEEFLSPFLENPKKYRFNLIGTATCGLGVPFARKNCYFCSQFVSAALHHSEILRIDRDFRLVRPFDFFELENTKEIYRGKIVEYTSPTQESEPELIYAE